MSPRLRKTGRYSRRGGAKKVIDRRKGKELLAELAAEEAAQIDSARARLATGQRLRLSQIGHLEPAAFELFLDLLGEALARQTGDRQIEATSSDGALRITLVPTEGMATITTHDGRLTGRDHFLIIRDSFTPRPEPSGDLRSRSRAPSEATP